MVGCSGKDLVKKVLCGEAITLFLALQLWGSRLSLDPSNLSVGWVVLQHTEERSGEQGEPQRTHRSVLPEAPGKPPSFHHLENFQSGFVALCPGIFSWKGEQKRNRAAPSLPALEVLLTATTLSIPKSTFVVLATFPRPQTWWLKTTLIYHLPFGSIRSSGMT